MDAEALLSFVHPFNDNITNDRLIISIIPPATFSLFFMVSVLKWLFELNFAD